jgi:hypothetical protein
MAEVDEVDNSKKAKLDSDWRTKCIEEFKLQPVPVTWSDQVARGSEKAWKNYFEYRKKQVKVSIKNDDDIEKEAVQEWECKMEDLEFEIFPEQEFNPEQPGLWQTHLCVEDLVMVDHYEMRSAQFHGRVYSPYALPHAIHLQHRYHRRPRMSTMEFFAEWRYKLLDFEDAQDEDFDEGQDDDDESGGFTTICSNCFEDERLRADVIEVSHLNQDTVDRLRRFLFGAIKESKPVCCDDFSFLRLLFGSMGTFCNTFDDDDTTYATLFRGWIGYSWRIPFTVGVREKMIKEGVIGHDEYSWEISWLEHRMRQVTGILRPIDAYYTAPTIKDAPGYRSTDSNDDSYS